MRCDSSFGGKFSPFFNSYAMDEKELDKNIKDAILTSFEIPSSYAKEAKIHRVGDGRKEYALA